MVEYNQHEQDIVVDEMDESDQEFVEHILSGYERKHPNQYSVVVYDIQATDLPESIVGSKAVVKAMKQDPFLEVFFSKFYFHKNNKNNKKVKSFMDSAQTSVDKDAGANCNWEGDIVEVLSL